MDRFSLTDAQWEKMRPFGLGKPTDPGVDGGENPRISGAGVHLEPLTGAAAMLLLG